MTQHLETYAAENLQNLRNTGPMVHHITNSVVTNFTANITLCLGAAPVMAPAEEESAEMAGHASALVLNIGTLDPQLVSSMMAAGRAANEEGIPVVLDPVGAGATSLRTESARMLADGLDIAVVRANAGEALTLAGESGRVRGVDSHDSVEGRAEALKELALGLECVVAVTGREDVITDGRRMITAGNGHSVMGRVTGTGCGATTAVACFCAAGEETLLSAAAGLACYGLAGEMAGRDAAGPGSFVPSFLDALASLDSDTVLSGLRLSG
jgi:hydroxyethylthiazole kinase